MCTNGSETITLITMMMIMMINKMKNQGNVGAWLRHASFSPCATPEEMQEDRGQALAPLVKACTPSALGGGLIGDPHPDCLFRIPAPLIA